MSGSTIHALPESEPIFTVDDVARHVRCSRRAVYVAIRSGALQAASINKRRDFRIRETWLNRWLDARSLTVTTVVNPSSEGQP